MADNTQQLQMGFTGKWNPTADPLLLKKGDYSDLQNFQYKDRGIKGVSGYTRINSVLWTAATTNPFSGDLHDVAYNGTDLWVAVGEGGELGTSPDGLVWTLRANPFTSPYPMAVAHNQINKWVATCGDEICTSPDGITWTLRSNPFSIYLFTGIQDVAYGGGIWIALGCNKQLATSTDGITWTLQTHGNAKFGVAYNGSNLWVAVGTDCIETSPNGITWTTRTSSFEGEPIYRVAHNQSNLWVAVGSSSKVATSPDGITWTQRTASAIEFLDVASNGELWVIVGDNNNSSISADGIGWIIENLGFGINEIYGLNYGGNRWVVVGGSSIIAVGILPRSD